MSVTSGSAFYNLSDVPRWHRQCARYVSLKTRIMATKQAPPSSDEVAKRFPMQNPSPERIRRLKAQGLKPLQVDVVFGDSASMKDLKSATRPNPPPEQCDR